MTKIIVVGSLNMDLVVRARHIPIPGETVLGSEFGLFPGGKGANQALAAARQGAQVAFIGRVGADSFGEQLARGLQSEGINTRYLGVDMEAPTGIALITLDAAGQNTIVVASGANARLTPGHIRQAEPAFAGADILLLQLETPLETVLAAAQQAKAHGMTVILNPSPAQPLPAELLARVDVLLPNENEAAALSGLPVETPEQAEIAARALLEQGVACVVVTLGSQGAMLVQPGRRAISTPAYPTQVVDTTSAGDAFTGALAVSLGQGLAPEQALQRGCAAGALAVARQGAQPSIPTASEVEQFLISRTL